MDEKVVSLQQETEDKRHTNDEATNHNKNGRIDSKFEHLFQPPIPEHLRPDLPTFPLDDGWRTVYDEETDHWYQIPLTLRDILFPTEDDVGAVFMSQGQTHNLLISLLVEMLRAYLGERGWYFPSDVLIRWGLPGVPDKSPDIAAIPNSAASTEGKKSFKVGVDGPMPAVVIEITSDSTRDDDFVIKRDTYAAVGVPEYLIIDIVNNQSEPWQLYGFRLGNSPLYQEIPPDPDGGITLQSLNLRFVPVQRTRMDIFDSINGNRLPSAAELKAMIQEEAKRANAEAERANAEAERANAEAERANAEAERAATAEATIEELQARLREFEANKKQGDSKS